MRFREEIQKMLRAIKNKLFLPLSAALLLIVSFPRGNISLLAWVAFIPLYFALRSASIPGSFFLSYLTGFAFWITNIFWLSHVTFAGMLALVFFLAGYFGVFGLGIRLFVLHSRKQQEGLSLKDVLCAASFWVVLEYARSHFPILAFPWALLGYSQSRQLPVIQIADITGVWGVSFLVMLVNAGIYAVVSSHRPLRQGVRNFSLAALCVCIVLGYGYLRLHQGPWKKQGEPFAVSVIQGNIPQELKWDAQARDFIMNTYQHLTREAMRDNPQLIIWPEAAIPAVLEEEPLLFLQIKELARQVHTPLLVGAVRMADNRYYNTALLLSAEGGMLEEYRKVHLVPFGEYIPFRTAFPFLEAIVPIGDFTAGGQYVLFAFSLNEGKPPHTFASLICFEDVFPELSRRFVRKGAGLLVNITNDAWFKKTASPYQHMQGSVFRAVENRRYVIRAANTGVSGFISPTGEVIDTVKDEKGMDIFVPGYKTHKVHCIGNYLSFYTVTGDWFVVICFLFCLAGIVRVSRPGKK